MTLILASACITLGVDSARADAEQRVLRIEYATDPDAQGAIETGIVFWRRDLIQGAEVPGDLIQRFADGFPVLLKLEGKLANACYVTNAGFGLALLERKESRLSGPLWFTADYAWTVDFSLGSDGTVRGTTRSIALKGSYREVKDFSECYARTRSATSSSAPSNASPERTRER
jgi:hypothetical protein